MLNHIYTQKEILSDTNFQFQVKGQGKNLYCEKLMLQEIVRCYKNFVGQYDNIRERRMDDLANCCYENSQCDIECCGTTPFDFHANFIMFFEVQFSSFLDN